ncbi:hypothetical protein C0993_008016, partial [Termitomyces sp. T159_Od127]
MLAVAYKLDSTNPEAEGNSFKLIDLLANFDLPHEDMKQTMDDATALVVKVKMVTENQLTIT